MLVIVNGIRGDCSSRGRAGSPIDQKVGGPNPASLQPVVVSLGETVNPQLLPFVVTALHGSSHTLVCE